MRAVHGPCHHRDRLFYLRPYNDTWVPICSRCLEERSGGGRERSIGVLLNPFTDLKRATTITRGEVVHHDRPC
jgi:hypothetical protein